MKLHIWAAWNQTPADYLRINEEDFKDSFESLAHVRLTGVIHRDTFLALANVTFGRRIQSIKLDMGSPSSYTRADENAFPFLPLPRDLQFELPALTKLDLTGQFHSTVTDAFGYPDKCPSLSEVSWDLREQDIGPIALEDYAFPDHLVAASSTWRIFPCEHSWNPYSVLKKLAAYPTFNSTRIVDGREEDSRSAATSETVGFWPHLCAKTNLRDLRGIQVGSSEILQHGLPPLLKIARLHLVPSGLSKDDTMEVAHRIQSIPSPAVFLTVRPEFPGVIQEKLQEECDLWREMRDHPEDWEDLRVSLENDVQVVDSDSEDSEGIGADFEEPAFEPPENEGESDIDDNAFW